MLLYAKYRHYNYHPVTNAGMTGTIVARGSTRTDRPPDQILRRRGLQTHYGQYPPPACLETAIYRIRWKLHRLHPPPLQKNGLSPPISIRSKDPPPVPIVYTKLYGKLLSRLTWLKSADYSHLSNKLTLASQHPPPTKGQVTVSHARRKINWQHPPPLLKSGQSPSVSVRSKDPPSTRRAVWRVLTTSTHLRSALMQLGTMSITLRGITDYFLIEVVTALYCRIFAYPKHFKIMLIHQFLKRRYLQTLLQLPTTVSLLRALYRWQQYRYVSDIPNVTLINKCINLIRQNLPSYSEYSDHTCLVGKYYLVNKANQNRGFAL